MTMTIGTQAEPGSRIAPRGRTDRPADARRIGLRIKAAREAKGFDQATLTRALGLNARQSLSAIEGGSRKVSADELLRAAEVLDRPVEWFADPLILAGEGEATWHVMPGKDDRAVRERCEGLAAAYRTLASPPPTFRQTARITRSSSDHDAGALGTKVGRMIIAEAAAAKVDMRDATLLMMESGRFNILVLSLDPGPTLAAGAIRLADLDVVFVDRSQPPWSMTIVLLSMLFHCLTWDALPPPAFVDLADRPAVPARRIPARTASLQVRFVEAAMEEIRGAGFIGAPGPVPLYSRRFMSVLSSALRDGWISTRRTAALLEMTIDELPGLFRTWNLDIEAGL